VEDVFVTVILDCSGSMSSSVAGVTAGLNTLFKSMIADKNRQYHVQMVEVGIKYSENQLDQNRICEVTDPRSLLNYKARAVGGTPLFDGIARVFNTSSDPAGLGANAICILISDGSEGGSVIHTDWNEVRNYIRDKVSTGWKFAYLAIGASAEHQAKQIEQEVQKFGGQFMYHRASPQGQHAHFMTDVMKMIVAKRKE